MPDFPDTRSDCLPRWTCRAGMLLNNLEFEPWTAEDIFSAVVRKALALNKQSVCFDESVNQDALLRGILHGWDEVRLRHGIFCPLWSILRYLDQRMFCLTRFMTRVCTMYMIHRLLLCLISGHYKAFSSLPKWYRPQNSQLKTPHVPAIDVLPWPSLRERAVQNASLTVSNHFWTRVIYDFRFHWPFVITEAFECDIYAGLFSFSALFEKYIRNIDTWQMDLAFFTAYPETYEDLVAAPTIPRSMQVERRQNQDREEHQLPLPLPAKGESLCLTNNGALI